MYANKDGAHNCKQNEYLSEAPSTAQTFSQTSVNSGHIVTAQPSDCLTAAYSST